MSNSWTFVVFTLVSCFTSFAFVSFSLSPSSSAPSSGSCRAANDETELHATKTQGPPTLEDAVGTAVMQQTSARAHATTLSHHRPCNVLVCYHDLRQVMCVHALRECAKGTRLSLLLSPTFLAGPLHRSTPWMRSSNFAGSSAFTPLRVFCALISHGVATRSNPLMMTSPATRVRSLPQWSQCIRQSRQVTEHRMEDRTGIQTARSRLNQTGVSLKHLMCRPGSRLMRPAYSLRM